MDMPTMDTPMLKLSVSLCPKSAADSTAVNSVAIVEEYLQYKQAGSTVMKVDKAGKLSWRQCAVEQNQGRILH
jgi:hypothetical protein